MEKHQSISDNELIKQFTHREIDKSTFTHEAQVRLTWVLLNELGRTNTTELIIQRIKERNHSKKKSISFDESLAKQTIRVLDIYRKFSDSDSFQTFKECNPNILENTIKLFTIN